MEENLVTIIEHQAASLADEIREHVRAKLEQALAEDTQRNHWLVMADAEGAELSAKDRRTLERSGGYGEGVQRVAQLLDIEIYEPYEPDV